MLHSLCGCDMWYEVDVYHVDHPLVNELWHEECGVRAGTGSYFDMSKNQALWNLVDSVGNKNGYFAKRFEYYYSYKDYTVYVLGQCEGDLGGDDCVDCVNHVRIV